MIQPVATALPPDGDDSIGTLVRKLIADAKSYAAAEFQLNKGKITVRIRQAGIGTGLVLGALVLLQAAIVALLVGLLLIIAQALGQGWATLIVVGGALAIVALLAWIAVGFFKRAAKGPAPKDVIA